MRMEYRVFSNCELRSAEDGKTISGMAAVFNQRSLPIGGFFVEEIDPGAFNDCLAGGADVRALVNHNPEKILGRTKAGTLRLSVTDKGLAFECDAPNAQYASDLVGSITRGDIDACSFGFNVAPGGDEWSEVQGADGLLTTVRRLTKVMLFDVSPVTFPAYPQTSVSARALWPDGEPEEVAEHRKEKNVASCTDRATALAILRAHFTDK